MSSIDLLNALGNAGEKDIEASAGELPGRKPVWKIILRWGAAAAAVCIGVIALRSADRSKIITVTMPSYQTEASSLQSGPETTSETSYVDAPGFTTNVLYGGITENRFLSLTDPLSLLGYDDWDVPEERRTLYFVSSHTDDYSSGTFHKIREAEKKCCRENKDAPQAQYAVYTSVYSRKTDGSPVVREWISPAEELGRIKGIFTVTQAEDSGEMQAVYTERNEASEDWIGRLEALGWFSSPEEPVCFLRDDQIGLIALASGKAYLIRPNEGTEIAAAEIRPALYVPDSEELEVGRVELSGTGIPVVYRAELTLEQQTRYKDILYSELEDIYLSHYISEGMDDEEAMEYFRKISEAQSPAVTVANYLYRNVVVSHDANGLPLYRDEYAGCYIAGSKLCVLIPSHVEGADEYMHSLFDNGFADRVTFRYVEYNHNELERFREEELIPTLKSSGIRMYMHGVSDTANCVLVSVFERDLIKCCELILEKGWVGKIRLERMDSEPVFTED